MWAFTTPFKCTTRYEKRHHFIFKFLMLTCVNLEGQLLDSIIIFMVWLIYIQNVWLEDSLTFTLNSLVLTDV